ncbi:hypothetical protein BSL78_01946 [Apostichopus japonicus]|uniref:B box-type domain-containing protein n=1 Tax=Stichopus japonicus TaxID=307972 RepID=A0A2G8LLI3_STIJA|nr:hypothetical protein BSL78_01946 [Apostichopus japonicus]
MTSSSTTSPFRLTLLKVSDVLTEQNVQDLAFLCEDISPARRELITNARELFAALQGHDLLNERKVNVLIDWLDELRLLEASNLLKNYRKTHLTGHVKAQENCFIHEDLPLKYFCVSCDSKICPDCAFTAHRDAGCDVISLDKMSNEMSQRREKLMKELEMLKRGIASTEQLWEEKKEHLARCREISRNEVQKDYFTLIGKVESMKRLQTKLLDGKELADIKKIFEEKKESQILENELAIITKCHKISHENALDEIQKISKSTKKTAEIKVKLEKQKEMLKNRSVDLLYRKVPNDGVFCSITVSTLIGSSILLSNQLLHTFDERQTSGGVLLICTDPKDSSKEYWRRLQKIDNQDDPVVMSNINMVNDDGKHTLFAVGNTVFIEHHHYNGSLYDYVKSVSSLVINEVPEGSWITSIATHYPNDDPNDEFIISTSCDHSIREYNVSGSAIRVIDTRDFVRSKAIYRIAYCGNLFAIIGRSLDDVILIDVDGTVKQCGTLRLPSAMSGMLPINIIWTGSKWLVLYISEGVEKEWKVVHYKKTGEFVKVCDEGTSSNELDVPLCVTRFQSTGYVTLANTKVRSFQY